MKEVIFFIFLSFTTFCSAQKITNLVYVGKKGITEKEKEAKYIIAIKANEDSSFERLEYNFSGPLIKCITFKDSSLNIKNGAYAEYYPSGFIFSDGNYINDKKFGSWFTYADGSHVLLEYKYDNDKLITIINNDSLNKVNKNKKLAPGDKEAVYEGGQTEFTKIVSDKIQSLIDNDSLRMGVDDRIRFVVNTDGQMGNFRLIKSTQISVDEMLLNVMRAIPNNWIPASHNGVKVKAYREIPIKFEIH